MSLKKQTKKPLTKQQKRDRDDYFSTFVALGIVLLVPVLIFLGSLVGDMLNGFYYSNEIKKGDRIDIENDVVVLTYPTGMFEDDEVRDDSVKTLKDSKGVKKVVTNSDGSVTALMNYEKYKDIKEAALYTAQSLPYISIGEDTAVRDLTYNQELTEFDITFNKDSEKVESECRNILTMMSLYHAINMDNDVVITVNYIDSVSSEVYKTEKYDINRNLIE